MPWRSARTVVPAICVRAMLKNLISGGRDPSTLAITSIACGPCTWKRGCGVLAPQDAARRDGDVLTYLEVVEQIRLLPCPRQAKARPFVSGQTSDVPSVELDSSRAGDESGDRVDQRRLAGAAGPDQAD
jgi:hypothetical protein